MPISNAKAKPAGQPKASNKKIEFIACPEYSTERYFLLSEIEEHSFEFVCLDDDGVDTSPDRFVASRRKMVVHYLTWNMAGGWASLENTVSGHISLCGGPTAISKHSLVVIDAIFRSSDYSAVMVKNAATEALNALQAGLCRGAGCILLGISNNIVAAPGLDAFYDILSTRDTKKFQWSIVTAKRVNFLGQDLLTFAPEAASNVLQQYACCPDLATYFQEQFGLDERASCVHESVDKSAPRPTDAVPPGLVRMQAILFAVLSALLYWMYSATAERKNDISNA